MTLINLKSEQEQKSKNTNYLDEGRNVIVDFRAINPNV